MLGLIGKLKTKVWKADRGRNGMFVYAGKFSMLEMEWNGIPKHEQRNRKNNKLTGRKFLWSTSTFILSVFWCHFFRFQCCALCKQSEASVTCYIYWLMGMLIELELELDWWLGCASVVTLTEIKTCDPWTLDTTFL